MSEGRTSIRLGEVLSLKNVKLGNHNEEPEVFAVTKHHGIVLSSDYFDRRVASSKLDDYKIVESGDWVYSTIHIDEGSIARNRSTFTGVVSPMYSTMEWRSSDHCPQYFELLLRQPDLLAVYGRLAQGSINRRRSLPWKTFASIEVQVPPLVEQRRIVDLVGAFDDVMGAAPVVEARSSYEQLLARYVFGSWPKEPLGSVLLLRTDSERVESSSSYRMIGVLRSGEGFIDRGEITGEKTNYSRLMRVHANQLVYRKLTAWEGPISVASTEEEGGYVSQEFPVFEIIPERILPRLLRHLCRSPWFWKEMENRLVGSVQRRKRLNPEALLSVEVPMPPIEEQEELCAGLDAALEVVAGYESYRDRLTLVRASTLELLLSGGHEIPASYDELIGEVA